MKREKKLWVGELVGVRWSILEFNGIVAEVYHKSKKAKILFLPSESFYFDYASITTPFPRDHVLSSIKIFLSSDYAKPFRMLFDLELNENSCEKLITAQGRISLNPLDHLADLVEKET